MQFLFPDDRSTQQTNVKDNRKESKRKRHIPIFFKKGISYNENLKTKKDATNSHFRLTEPSIARSSHFLQKVVENLQWRV